MIPLTPKQLYHKGTSKLIHWAYFRWKAEDVNAARDRWCLLLIIVKNCYRHNRLLGEPFTGSKQHTLFYVYPYLIKQNNVLRHYYRIMVITPIKQINKTCRTLRFLVIEYYFIQKLFLIRNISVL